MPTPTAPARSRFASRRWLAVLAAATMPAATLVALPSAAHADPEPAPVPATLTWKVSDRFVAHLSTLTASDGATLSAEKVTTFTGGRGWVDPTTGDARVSYAGSITGAFAMFGTTHYSIKIADPEITVADGRGTVRADVDWTVPSETPSTGSTDDVVLTTFDATAADWSGGSLTATPHWAGVLPADSEQATALGIGAGKPVNGKSWAPEFLGALQTRLRPHFYAGDSSASSDSKAPSSFTAVAPAPAATATTAVAEPSGLQVHVEGTGFAPTGNGVYVAVTEAGPIDSTNQAAYLGTKWLPADAIAADGTFSVDLERIAPGQLDATKTYEVHTQKAHGSSATDPSQNVRIPLTIPAGAYAKPTPRITMNGLRATYGKGGTIKVTVPGATGDVTLTLAGRRTTRTLSDAKATFQVPRKLRGARTYVARLNYAGSEDLAAASTTRKVTILAARTSTGVRTIKKPTRVRAGRALVSVRNISRTGVLPNGRVKVTLKKGRHSWKRLVWLKNGRANVVLPKRSKGTWRATYTYLGRPGYFRASTKSVRLVVR